MALNSCVTWNGSGGINGMRGTARDPSLISSTTLCRADRQNGFINLYIPHRRLKVRLTGTFYHPVPMRIRVLRLSSAFSQAVAPHWFV